MKIIINGKDAVLKKGTSFEFVAENRSFTGSDSYTLSITFPLRGCPENIAIFGYINRTDIDKSRSSLIVKSLTSISILPVLSRL